MLHHGDFLCSFVIPLLFVSLAFHGPHRIIATHNRGEHKIGTEHPDIPRNREWVTMAMATTRIGSSSAAAVVAGLGRGIFFHRIILGGTDGGGGIDGAGRRRRRKGRVDHFLEELGSHVLLETAEEANVPPPSSLQAPLSLFPPPPPPPAAEHPRHPRGEIVHDLGGEGVVVQQVARHVDGREGQQRTIDAARHSGDAEGQLDEVPRDLAQDAQSEKGAPPPVGGGGPSPAETFLRRPRRGGREGSVPSP
mmetsp:Transcript_36181/g.108346  ORF Transcript_36181/g.108346 Transcript_36181/m.108346 type:complete len:250 (-) Transcript_36181:2042-2791(-)